MGGIIAASFAQYHASLVQSLVLVGPVGLLRKSHLSAWTRFIRWGGWGWGWEGISAKDVYAFVGPDRVEEGWEKKFKEKGLDAIPRDAVQVWEREKHKGHMSSVVSAYRYSGVYDSHDTYASIAKSNLKTLMLLGENDGFFTVEYMKKELESLAWMGKVQVINGVGHGIIAEKTKEVEESVLVFWDELKEI